MTRLPKRIKIPSNCPFGNTSKPIRFLRFWATFAGASALDLACGEGFYTRKIMQAGARAVTGVDISAEMIKLAEAEERVRPLGCAYLHRDAADLDLTEQVDLVVAMYLLNYAKTPADLLRFVEVAHRSLRPGGRFVGFNDNVQNVPQGTVSFPEYGFDKTCANGAARGRCDFVPGEKCGWHGV